MVLILALSAPHSLAEDAPTASEPADGMGEIGGIVFAGVVSHDEGSAKRCASARAHALNQERNSTVPKYAFGDGAKGPSADAGSRMRGHRQ